MLLGHFLVAYKTAVHTQVVAKLSLIRLLCLLDCRQRYGIYSSGRQMKENFTSSASCYWRLQMELMGTDEVRPTALNAVFLSLIPLSAFTILEEVLIFKCVQQPDDRPQYQNNFID